MLTYINIVISITKEFKNSNRNSGYGVLIPVYEFTGKALVPYRRKFLLFTAWFVILELIIMEMSKEKTYKFSVRQAIKCVGLRSVRPVERGD